MPRNTVRYQLDMPEPQEVFITEKTSRRNWHYDNLFSAPYFVAEAHHEIHEGDMYTTVIYDEGAASGDVIHVFMLTPAVSSPQKRIHMIYQYEGTGEHSFTMTGGCTYSSGGAALTPQNRNLGSDKTSSLQSAYTGSDKGSNNIVVTGGSVIVANWDGSGKLEGGGDRSVNEWVLAPGTGYLFEVESQAAGIVINMRLTWYEHTDE